jgi:hypothetical protein
MILRSLMHIPDPPFSSYWPAKELGIFYSLVILAGWVSIGWAWWRLIKIDFRVTQFEERMRQSENRIQRRMGTELSV